MTNVSITSGQKERIAQLVIDMLVSMGADRDSAQAIITRGGDLQAAIREPLLDIGALRYKSEEVESKYGYPQGFAVRPVCEQLLTLVNIFPGLDASKALACSKEKRALPEGMDGLFAIPKWEKIAKTYNEAVEKVIVAIEKSGRPFQNWRKGELNAKYLKRSERTEKAMAAISNKQDGDFIVIPAQLGMLHRGRSIRRAREVMKDKEFGLGAYEMGIILLTHPERLQAYENLWIDCPGDEYSPDAGGRFVDAPIFDFDVAGLHFVGGRWVSRAYEYYGSASGLLPQ